MVRHIQTFHLHPSMTGIDLKVRRSIKSSLLKPPRSDKFVWYVYSNKEGGHRRWFLCKNRGPVSTFIIRRNFFRASKWGVTFGTQPPLNFQYNTIRIVPRLSKSKVASDVFVMIEQVHSVSSNRDTLIRTRCRLRSVEKLGDSSLFGGKYKGQNSLFLALFWFFYAVEPQKSIKKIHFSKFDWP